MKSKLPYITLIKITHSAIWLTMASAIFYILYCGITNNLNNTLYISIGLIVLEIVVLLINGWACPLTIVAKNCKSDWKDGDDIYLPKWLAVNNKMIFGSLFVFGIVLVIMRLLS
jgi:hypothetical protein